MNIVVISAKCYPWNSPRAFRADELTKELVRQGHHVTLYSLLGDYDYESYSKLTGVCMKSLGKPKWGLIDTTGGGKRNLLVKILEHSIGKYFDFPDCALKTMVRDALNKEGEIDLLITIAVPHAIHFGASLARLDNVKMWVGDCGDPFMGNPFTKKPFYMAKWEKKWCERCDYITIPVLEGVNAYYPEFRKKIRIIPQGFDFNDSALVDYKKNDIPTFAYAGYIYPGQRDPIKMLDYLKGSTKEFRFYIYTAPVCVNYLQPYKEELKEKLILNSYVPREELLTILSGMDFLVNIINNSNVQQPSKLIDYAISKRPILNVSTDFSEDERSTFLSFLAGDYSMAFEMNNIEQYNIKNVARKFLDLTYE